MKDNSLGVHVSPLILICQIAAEVAAPLSQCKKIVMVSNGKTDVGANKITGEILDIVANLPKSVEALTGIDISKVKQQRS